MCIRDSHTAGDKLIKDAVDFLNSIFGKNDIIVRFGGDEYITMLRNNTNNENFGEDLSSRINKEMKKSPVSMAFGVAVYNKNLDSARLNATTERAEELMYERK